VVKNVHLRQLKVFEGSGAASELFARRPRNCSMSQPGRRPRSNSSKDMRGCRCSSNWGRRYYLTSAGHEMLRHSRAVIQQFREADEALAALKGIGGGRLDIAVISAGDYFFPA